MLRAMDAAVAGLRAHQNKMDVVGHNIANVNTFGFKAQTYTFKEAMYQTSNSSTAGTETAAGANIQPLTEVRLNRQLNGMAGGICHQSPHSCKLLDLFVRTTGAGICHHINVIVFIQTT